MQFVLSDHVGHNQIIGAQVAALCRGAGYGPCFQQDHFVGLQEPGKLGFRTLAVAGGTRNRHDFRNICRHGNGHPTQRLDALRQEIDDGRLLFVVLVEKQVDRVEVRPRRLPVVLLVQVAQRHRIGQRLLQAVDARGFRLGIECKRIAPGHVVRLGRRMFGWNDRLVQMVSVDSRHGRLGHR